MSSEFGEGDIEGVSELREIGRGGFGVVYGGIEENFRREVAVKILPATSDQKGRDRFERERMAMGALTGHPNIVTVYRGGFTVREQPYLVMEYLPGGSLADVLTGSGPFSWEQVADTGVKMAAAVETAHRAGVLHRDIKPGNIFQSNLGEPKLGDFGISRLRGGTETRSAAVTASVAHAPPEVIAGERPDEASDVYSLASTLYELLAGTPAFFVEGESSIAPMLGRIAIGDIPSLDLEPSGARLLDAIGRAMNPDRTLRPSAAEFGEIIRSTQGAAGVAVTPLQIVGDSPVAPAGSGLTSQLTPIAQNGSASTAPGQMQMPAGSPVATGPQPISLSNANGSSPAMTPFLVGGAALLVLAVLVGGFIASRRGDSPTELATGTTIPVTVPTDAEPTVTQQPAPTLPPVTIATPDTALDNPSNSEELLAADDDELRFVIGRDKTGGIELDVPEAWAATTIDITEDPALAGIIGLLENPGGVTFGGTTSQIAGDGPDARNWNISGAYVSKLNNAKTPDERLDAGMSTEGDGMSGWSECTVGERGDIQTTIGPGRYQEFLNCGGTSTTSYDMYFRHRSDPEIMVELVIQLSTDPERDPEVLDRIVSSLKVDLSRFGSDVVAADAGDNKTHIDQSGAVTAEVPAAWAKALTLDYRDDLGIPGAEVIGVSGVSFGLTANELAHGDESQRNFARSGVSFKVSRTEPTSGPQGYESCSTGAQTTVTVDAGTGMMQEFSNCGGQDTKAFFMVLQSSDDSEVFITMWLQISDRAEFDLDLETGIPAWLRIDTSDVAA